MSVTLESALENQESDEQFGLNLQLESESIPHAGYTTIYGKPEPKAKSRRKSEGVSDITLVKLATVGFFEGLWNLFLYLNLWYAIYPTLLFSSFYMSQILLKPDLATLTPISIFGALAAGCAGLYYAYYLLITFVCESSDPAMYAEERPYFLFRICMYSLIMGIVLYSANLLKIQTILNPENQRLFISFYLMYIIATVYLKYISYKISNR
ncbi:MAG: hypothetical protein ACD_39C01429G0002 [uncultured bacterium]|nr:MAG: hypothetical protein ACD_39C01429G0002 [uncultured bacterium]